MVPKPELTTELLQEVDEGERLAAADDLLVVLLRWLRRSGCLRFCSISETLPGKTSILDLPLVIVGA